MDRPDQSYPPCRPRKAYPSDVSDDEWAFVAPYLTLMTPEAPQRKHALRELFNARRSLALPARRLPALGGGLPADAALDQGRMLRGDRPRPSRGASRSGGERGS